MTWDDPSNAPYFEQRKIDRLYQKFCSKKSMLLMLEMQASLCPICGESLAPNEDFDPLLHVHHLIPRSQGGPNVYSNLMIIHDACHRKSHSATMNRAEVIRRLRRFVTESGFSEDILAKVRILPDFLLSVPIGLHLLL
jgi:RNA-directed DNA polymerase